MCSEVCHLFFVLLARIFEFTKTPRQLVLAVNDCCLMVPDALTPPIDGAHLGFVGFGRLRKAVTVCK